MNSPIAYYKGETYNMPFNMNTFSKMWGVVTPAEAKAKIAEQIAAELDTVDTGITGFDEVAVRQLISAIKVLSADKLLVRFNDGTEIEQIL